MEVLQGAAETIARCKPVLLIETIKTNLNELQINLVDSGYTHMFGFGINVVAIHHEDPLANSIKIENGMISFV